MFMHLNWFKNKTFSLLESKLMDCDLLPTSIIKSDGLVRVLLPNLPLIFFKIIFNVILLFFFLTRYFSALTNLSQPLDNKWSNRRCAL